MSEDYYKARIGELSRELEAAHAELGQYGADIKMLEKRNEELGTIVNQYDYAEECQDEQKLWELYLKFLDKYADDDVLSTAQEALKVWKERK